MKQFRCKESPVPVASCTHPACPAYVGPMRFKWLHMPYQVEASEPWKAEVIVLPNGILVEPKWQVREDHAQVKLESMRETWWDMSRWHNRPVTVMVARRR